MFHTSFIIALVGLVVALATSSASVRDEVRKFPEGFLFGVATASYQVEGAWDEDGKAESIWDHLTHTTPCAVKDCSNADIADDSYHQIERDVEMMRELGVDFYRISMSWPRILPNSFSNDINEAGVKYYDNLFNEMLKYNIEPMVSLYHWDLPQKLQDVGGWANPNIVDWFGDYARTSFELFGDRVKSWITINEPQIVCMNGYGGVSKAPLLNQSGTADYLCTKNILMAHARAYHIYNEEFRASQGGEIAITLNARWYYPDSEEHAAVADEANEFHWGLFAHPIFSDVGDYPAIVKENIAEKSAAQGYPRSRLPELTPEEITYLKGSSDFFGLNHYSSYIVYRNESTKDYYPSPSYWDDKNVIIYQKDEWRIGESDFTMAVPRGFYSLLTSIREKYNNPLVLITENGFATYGGLEDNDRVTYLKQYLDAMLDAIEEGSNIGAYTAWSLMDNFEWLEGYTERFGLYEVDYEDPARTRTPRKSAFVYKQILRTRELDPHYEPPQGQLMTIDDGHYFTSTSKLFHTMLHKTYIVVVFCVALSSRKSTGNTNRDEVRKFPEGFMFGTATASYQVEGAWDEDGKSENIWDHLTHTDPCAIKDCSNGDIADDSYHQVERDVQMLRELGVDFYRFSLSWTRIMPTSFPDQINPAGVSYYNRLIDEMLKYNIQPMITLYHWDLPQKLQEMGGWTNPYIVDWFADYARTAFSLFGDRVKIWNTMNEPNAICYLSYGTSSMAPRLNIPGVAEYICAKNLLLAHAKAYHIYNNEFKPINGGEIGIVFDVLWYEPATENDTEAAMDLQYFTWQQYAHPIFSETGDYPARMKEKIAAKSTAQGFLRSRQPQFTPEEIDYVRGTSDFFGLNHYSTAYVYRNESVYGYHDSPSFYDDVEVIRYQTDEYVLGDSTFTKVVPWGFYRLLMKIRDVYNNPKVYITENGFATLGGLDDDARIAYYRLYLDAMLDAIEEGCDIRAYTAWSLMDNFEWMQGYVERFGLYEVDYEDPVRTRTPRKSAFVYKQMLRTRELDPHYEPPSLVPVTTD
ncbi:lactase/phlorizin hydrolase-like [Pectinophora gossypiella]|uniref:lactase/phlorizin hydrolase-like n=1 Tax=Pectinophora gossypiella TaxID=13191 RepID=UPI00214DF10D|nr:lactase/phlorizin hydrolase-like [Pectinophora gossypiella]